VNPVPQWAQLPADAWQYGLALLTLVLAVGASGHALLYKRDHRAAAFWVTFIWFVPLAGALFYSIFGINRLKRHATLLRANRDNPPTPRATDSGLPFQQLAATLPPACRHLVLLAESNSRVLKVPLVAGNRVDLLVNGDRAFPAMLAAIDAAQESIGLSSYIFDHDETGLLFAQALGAAVRRGVEVRVLIDATGMRYSWPSIARALRREGVRYARFLPTSPLWQILSLNLRNHRKLLIVDGRVGFTGGMNIRTGHWLEKSPAHPVRDLHFRIEGPVVAQLQQTFADDWQFTTREALRSDQWFPPLAANGPVIARGVADGPDEDIDSLRWAILAALAAARHSVRIATPYFLPDATIVATLNLAALRGVRVDILLPQKSNLPFVHWASATHWWQVLVHGCRIWLSPPPFDHSKLFVVDDCWTFVGSTNWDPRSLRLNFEYNVECYDPVLARTMADWFDTQLTLSHQTSLAEMDARSLPVRLRDGTARLLTPFL